MAPITPPKTPPIIAALLVLVEGAGFALVEGVGLEVVVVAGTEEEIVEERLALDEDDDDEDEDDDDDGSTPGKSMKPRLEDCLCVLVYTGGSACGFKRITNCGSVFTIELLMLTFQDRLPASLKATFALRS